MGVLIVNPNPVFDRTITLDSLVPGAVMRTLDVEVTAGGKGINVARVLRSLGVPAPLVIPVGALDRPRYEALLQSEGAEASVVEVPGSVRIASIYLERTSDRVTVVNDAGSAVGLSDWDRVRSRALELLQPGDLVLCMGSFPPGLDFQALDGLIGDAHDRGALVLVDANPDWLRSCLPQRPDVVTPNVHEAEAALNLTSAHVMEDSGADDDLRERATRAAARLVEGGAGRALVTAGAAGVAMADQGGVDWQPAFRVEAVSTVGAGDSFVAGLAHEWARHGPRLDWRQAVCLGIATAAASCEQVRAGGIDVARTWEIHDLVLQLQGRAA